MGVEEKLAAFRAGQYVFKAPPVCHAQWTDLDWVRYIDGLKGWRVPHA